MNSISVNLHGYCNKRLNLHNYTQSNIGHFQIKLCKFYAYYDLTMFFAPWVSNNKKSWVRS